MKRFLTIAGSVALMLVGFWLFGPTPTQPKRMVDLPWQIETFEDGTSKVFGIHLYNTKLEQLIAKYGAMEGIALFVDKQGRMSMEVFFHKVKTGPLLAKLVVTLEVPEEEMKAMAERALTSESTAVGDSKLILAEADKGAQGHRVIKALAYIPSYRRLDAPFFRQRFGEPASWKRIDEHTVQWFYPDRGLSIRIDAEAGEVMEYEAPKDYDGPTESPEEEAKVNKPKS